MNKLYYLYEPDNKKTIDESILETIHAAESKFKLPEIKEIFVHPKKLPEVTIQSETVKVGSAYFGSETGVKIYICDIDPE